jgi:hypothetical protein
MRWLIAFGLTLALAAGSARAATPSEVLCASYKNAVAKETDRAKKDAMLKSRPHGCGVRAPMRKRPEPVTQAQPAPEAAPQPIPAAIPEPAPEPPPEPAVPLPTGVTVEQANANGNKAYQSHDYGGAMHWFRMSAGQGDATAEDDIGELYFYGHGVGVDYGQAMAWYRRSAAKGNATAQDGIGALYARGQGVAVDYAEAMKWFRLSAAQGNTDAANWIGYFYTHGLGVPQNPSEAERWYAKARASGR